MEAHWGESLQQLEEEGMYAKVIQTGGMQFLRIDNGRVMKLTLHFRNGDEWEIISERSEDKTLKKDDVYFEISNEMFEKFFALEYFPAIRLPEIRKG